MRQQKELIIHCGFHKTASSSIQHTLGKNRERLKKEGYYYPDLLVEDNRFYNQSIPVFGFFTSQPEEFPHYVIHNHYDPVHINQLISNIIEDKISVQRPSFIVRRIYIVLNKERA